MSSERLQRGLHGEVPIEPTGSAPCGRGPRLAGERDSHAPLRIFQLVFNSGYGFQCEGSNPPGEKFATFENINAELR